MSATVTILYPSRFAANSTPDATTTPRVTLPMTIVERMSLSVFVDLPDRVPEGVMPTAVVMSVAATKDPATTAYIDIEQGP